MSASGILACMANKNPGASFRPCARSGAPPVPNRSPAAALFLVCCGLVFELLNRRPKLFERGGVLRTHLFRWLATRIGMLDCVEHRACERQRCAAMILVADEVEFRPSCLVALKTIETQEVVHVLSSAADDPGAVFCRIRGRRTPSRSCRD